MKIVITDSDFPANDYESVTAERIGARLFVGQCRTQQEVIQMCKDADGILVQYAPLGRQVIDSLRCCKGIVRYGIGLDNIDLEAATAKRIMVANVPDYCQHEVAEHTLALIFALRRKLLWANHHARAGRTGPRTVQPIFRLCGETLGLFGFGRIAQTLAQKVRSLGLLCIAHDPYVSPEPFQELAVRPVSREELFGDADIVSIHTPLTEETRRVVSEDCLRRMKPTALLINTARGQVIDEAALVGALRQRRIAGAGLDVYWDDPLPPDHPFVSMDNIILTGHIAFYSEQSLYESQQKAMDQLIEILQGRVPKYWVNHFQ